MEAFLKQCEQSGDAAYGALRSLLERLEDPITRTGARIFLSDLQKRFASKEESERCLQIYHFQIQDIYLEQYEGFQRRKKLTMMVIPSIFIPEDWSFTFFEGLNRHPDSIFKDKTVTELGCGNGWISIAIAEKWSPLKILNPNPDAMSKMITENASEEFLHSLSNYCALQGFVEDQFGLGLIARAVEEGISVIKSQGIMIFNMGGRPGQAVCKRLFERRGLRVNKLWQTKVLQAADTDILALVEIEKNSPHRFEFFMGLVGDQPICARSAWAYAKSGGRISHALSVYSCQLRQPTQVKTIFEFLRNGFKDISSSLDLSFEDDFVADEKIPFLSYLASVLKEVSFFPYEPPAGSRRFRSLIAGFMRTYHHIPLTADNIVVFPSRTVAIESALRFLSPHLAIVDEQLSRHLPRPWLTSLNIENAESGRKLEEVTVIEAPRQSDLMVELIKKLKPEVVVTGMAKFESVTGSAFEHLLDTTREIGCRLFLDISDHFELSSLPSSNGVLKYLAGTPLPSHAAIICGLLKNQVYSDLEVAFVISEEETIFKTLCKTVELLQGNTAIISQYYYGCLFHELLTFQLADRHPPAQRNGELSKASKVNGLSSSTISVLDHAELAISESDESPLVHMDVDKIFLPMITPVKAAIFESFARQNITESESDVTCGIKQLICSSYGFSSDNHTEFIYADSPVALFVRLVLCCVQEGGTLCFPTGSNGNYVSAAKFLKANIVNIPTNPNYGFKLTETILTDRLKTVKKPWIYISGPTVNPTGLLYGNEEMQKLLIICANFGARVILDTSFSGVEFNFNDFDAWNLGATMERLSSTNQTFSVCLLGGLSYMMLTSGLEFGFLILNQMSLKDTFHGFAGLSKPHSTIRYTVKKLLDLIEKKSVDLLNAIAEQKQLLASRYKHFKQTLESCGWEVVEAQAGASIVAKPSFYLGKTIKMPKDSSGIQEIKLDDSNIREAMIKITGLCINSAAWTGIPGYCRFTIGLEDGDFKRALDCIAKFKSLVDN
ncbi:methionine S-methyltransferase-like isoform X4 [Primulina huaijiensis]|uniref:methionine S-methyltransferase-like isoform X4 n=1 Tax=Primulina huaijiensis TaxID=1492673 RepID=UPI003CC730D4